MPAAAGPTPPRDPGDSKGAFDEDQWDRSTDGFDAHSAPTRQTHLLPVESDEPDESQRRLTDED